MSKKPIKSSLFRFVTLRSPQAIEGKENKFGLILPNSSVKASSTYYQAASGVTEGDEAAKKAALEGASFTALSSKSEIKSVSNAMAAVYDFSSWLMRNKNYLSHESIESNLPSNYLLESNDNNFTDISLTNTEQTQVWDNLLYQTINKTSTSLRETYIQMLIADKFLKVFREYHMSMPTGEGKIVFTDQDEDEFRKRANASVVIEKEVLLSSRIENQEAANKLPETTVKYLEEDLTIKLAKERIAEYNNSLLELKKEETLYNKKNEEAYESSLKTHEDSVKAEYDRVRVIDPVTGDETYPGLALPEFNYIPLTIDFQDSSGEVFSKSAEDPSNLLSSKTLELLKNDSFNGLSDFASIRKNIKDCLAKEQSLIIDKRTSGKRTVKLGGSKVTIDPLETLQKEKYCFIGSLQRQQKLLLENDTNIFMNIATGRDNAYINSATFTLVHDTTQTSIPSLGTSLISNNKTLIYKFLFGNTSLPLGTYTFSGILNFANGDVVNFTTSINFYKKRPGCGNITSYKFSGCGVLNNATDPISSPSLKGVVNLGVADFRRVEQEVCCYVPGEVSHIENILAKEYKEKATRSLVSSEVTTEVTSEREVENLTDTTSTERNELQNEASSVIDEEKSKSSAANASVSGKKFGISFGVSGSSSNSSSTSTSDSNSQAQTYAQEITERALERVVEKVSRKRTSRVLREFEENNKHGFDNTKGENHITGVYRWVDKVYENQIVNYGKRLTYEFSIPEPSRYLKEALYLEPQEETSDLNLATPSLPTHPINLTDINISSASDINEGNYQLIAGKYNADVSSPDDEYLKIGKAFIKEDRSYDSQSYGFNEIEVPNGYIATSGIIKWAVLARNHGDRYLSIALGDARKTVFESTGDTAFYNFSDTYVGNIPFSFFSSHVFTGHFNVTVNCKRTDESYKKWQDETYKAILDAYNDRVQEYNDFQLSQQDITTQEEGEFLKFNSAFNRSMEKRELKRLAIELLTKSTNITISKDNYVTVDEKPQIKATEEFEQHAATVKFFEQAFDWEIMAYQLHPYYYAKKDNWDKLITQKEDADPIFQAFLQSGMATMTAPVRPGFETAVNWYMSTGEVWNGQGLVTDINDELYLSAVEEMLEITGQPVGEPWKTRIPTSLTIVQGKSAYLDETGLPCDPDCGEITTISGTNLVLSGGTGSNASSGVGADTVGTDNTVV